MRTTRRRLALAVGTVAIAALVVGVTTYVLVFQNSKPFHGSLTEVREGSWHSGSDGRGLFVVLQLQFSSPATLDGSSLSFRVSSPSNETIQLANHTTVTAVNVDFNPGWFPPWLATFPGGRLWSGFAATVTNPDGSLVATSLPVGQPGLVTGLVQNGALVNMTFPFGTSPEGYAIAATYGASTVETVLA